ncbi:MAG: PIG-L family deacetylase [Chloroflexi bacterium]|nr:PIG-L family deacetylase [Chloroflexota bacterium]
MADQIQDSAIPERAIAKTNSTEPAPPSRVMVVHAHPDDQEFTVAGTLAKWARAGSEIISVIITSGDAGSNEKTNPTMTKEKLAPLREAEQRAANRVLGVHETIFLRYPDGELEPTLQLRRDLTRLIRKYKPDAVLSGDPTVRFYGNNYLNHPDHRAAANATLDAVFPSAGTRFIFTELLAEGLEPHNVKWVFIHGAEKPDVWIDISETIEIKIQALQQHATQIGGWDVAKEMRAWAEEEGKAHELKYAEAFRLMVLVEEKKDEQGAEAKG